MSRPIDGEEYMELLKEQYLHHKSIGNGEIAKAWQGAMQLLYDMPTLTPPNEPLTLEQLRVMGGKPVWVKVIGKTGIRCDGWCEVEIREKDPFAYVWWPGSEVEDIAKIEDYGKTWSCYAYPPARIDREAWTAEWKDHYKSGVHAGTGAICSSCDVWNERKTHICPFCGKAMDEDGFAMLEKRMGVR